MPYSTPSHDGPVSSPPLRPFQHRRSRSNGSFSDERGPGAFVSLGALPRSHKRAVFHINVPDDDLDDRPAQPAPSNSLRLSMNAGRFSPSIEPPSRIDIPPPPQASVPFPISSPLSPTDQHSPFIRSASSTNVSTPLPRTPSTPIILSNGKPLKPSLKSSSSSPNIPNALSAHRAHLRAQSAPSTPIGPKNVHFAEKDQGLETVRVFSRSGKPASLSKPPGEETETETEADSATPSSFPFPLLSSPTESVIYEIDPAVQRTSQVPAPNPSPYANVHLETLALPRTHPPTLRGTVLVRNLAFDKCVAVRFTLDDWQTTSEVLCKHVVSLPGLPPPFPHLKSLGDVAGSIASGGSAENVDKLVPAWDRFSFVIRLEDYAYKLGERTLFLAARYMPCTGGEWWDNNAGANFRVSFRRAPAQTSSRAFEGSLGLAGMGLGMGFGMGFDFSTSPTAPHHSNHTHTHAQQRTFSAPSTLKGTPTTAELAVATSTPPLSADSSASPSRSPSPSPSPSPAPGHRHSHMPAFMRPPSASFSGAPTCPAVSALARSHSSPFPSASPPPQPGPPRAPPCLAASNPCSPVLRFVARRLSLSNYAAPAPVPVFHEEGERELHQRERTEEEAKEKAVEMRKEEEKAQTQVVEKDAAKAKGEMVTPPSTPPGSIRVRRKALVAPPAPQSCPDELSPLGVPWDALPASAKEAEKGEPAETGMLSPPSSPVRGLGLQIADEKEKGEKENEQSEQAEGAPAICLEVDVEVDVTGPEGEVAREDELEAEHQEEEHEEEYEGVEHEDAEEQQQDQDQQHPEEEPAVVAPAAPAPTRSPAFQSDSSYAELIRKWCFGGASLSPALTSPPSGSGSERGTPLGARTYGYNFPGAATFGFGTAPDAGMVGAHMR